MDDQKAHLLTRDDSGGQWIMPGFSALLFLLASPVLFFGGNLAFGLFWTLGLIAMNAPSFLWPIYTVYINAEGFRIEAPWRESTFYPIDEFVEVSIVDAFTKVNTYLKFRDGKQYRVVLVWGFQQSIKLSFLDAPPFTETKKVANKQVRDIIAVQQLNRTIL